MRYLHHLRLTLALQFLSQYALPTLANTEIVNFAAGDPVLVEPFPKNWTVLHARANEIIVRDRIPAPLRGGPRDSLCDDELGKDVHPFMRQHCPHELWLALDLDGYLVGDDGDLEEKREDNKARKWKGHYYDRFTLRVSWPASHPVQVELSLHRPHPASPSAASAASARTARLHFARIRLTREGVRVPRNAEERDGPAHAHARSEHGDEEGVPLVVLLEPLVLGVLPASVLPVAVALLLLLLLGVLGSLGSTTAVRAWVWGPFGEVVERVRGELAVLEERKER